MPESEAAMAAVVDGGDRAELLGDRAAARSAREEGWLSTCTASRGPRSRTPCTRRGSSAGSPGRRRSSGSTPPPFPFATRPRGQRRHLQAHGRARGARPCRGPHAGRARVRRRVRGVSGLCRGARHTRRAPPARAVAGRARAGPRRRAVLDQSALGDRRRRVGALRRVPRADGGGGARGRGDPRPVLRRQRRQRVRGRARLPNVPAFVFSHSKPFGGYYHRAAGYSPAPSGRRCSATSGSRTCSRSPGAWR